MKNLVRRIILTATLIAGLAPAIAAAPPAVPALPDAPRQTTYTLTNQTCACAVNFALYGDGTDYQNWVEVWLNGKMVSYNDPTYGWTITSPTGVLGLIPVPITDAVLTFNNPQTGTVQIMGARRPRRVAQFSEQRGVAARDLNVAITDLVAQNRENWDKTNDLTGRGFFFAPGTTVGPMPTPAQCANAFFGFDGTGENPLCAQILNAGSLATPGSTTNGDLAIWNGTDGKHLGDSGVAPSGLPTLAGTNAFTGANSFAGPNTFSGATTFSGDAYFKSGRPWRDVRAYGAVGDNVHDDTSDIQSAISAGPGVVYFPPGNYKITSTLAVNSSGIRLVGAGPESTSIYPTGDMTGIAYAANIAWSSFENMSLYGYRTDGNATKDLVTVGTDSLIVFRDCLINGGHWGLNTAGVDGEVDNCGIAGWGSAAGNVYSTGANWYQRCKFDQGSVTVDFGFRQGPSTVGSPAENHFLNCDFSGNFTLASFSVDDGGLGTAIMINQGGVFSGAVKFDNAKFGSLIGAEFGSGGTASVTNAGSPLSITGSYGFSAVTATGAGTRSCSSNINVTC